MKNILPTNAGWYVLAGLWKVAVLNAARSRSHLELLTRLQHEGVGRGVHTADLAQVGRDDARAEYLFGLMNEVGSASALPPPVAARRRV